MHTPLPRCTPEAQGLSSQAILSWLDALAAAQLELHSFILLRAGQVLAEGWWAPYSPERPHLLNSLSKSFTSVAVGYLVTDGKVSLDDRLVDLFADALPEQVSDFLAAMRVRDLLTMRTGHAADTTGAVVTAPDGDWVRAFLAQPVTFAPGTHFVYNTAATFILSALVQRLTGITLLEFLRPRLLEPLGIGQAHWEVGPRGIQVGGWGLHLTTEDIARFGQCLLQQGRWEGEQVIPEAWVQEATRAHVPPGQDAATNDWANGYGYQFWMCRHGAYRGDGAFGQFCVVMPQQQAVLAITAYVSEMQAILNQVWAHLLPAFGAEALPEDPAAQSALQERCAALTLALPEFTGAWNAAPRDETFTFAPNSMQLQQMRLVTRPDDCTLHLKVGQAEQVIHCGLKGWEENHVDLWPGRHDVILARAGRSAQGLMLVLVFIESGFSWTVTLQDGAGELQLQTASTVNLGAEVLLAQRSVEHHLSLD